MEGIPESRTRRISIVCSSNQSVVIKKCCRRADSLVFQALSKIQQTSNPLDVSKKRNKIIVGCCCWNQLTYHSTSQSSCVDRCFLFCPCFPSTHRSTSRRYYFLYYFLSMDIDCRSDAIRAKQSQLARFLTVILDQQSLFSRYRLYECSVQFWVSKPSRKPYIRVQALQAINKRSSKTHCHGYPIAPLLRTKFIGPNLISAK
jgi:hypothetical protein